jgi:hypothetical protein
VRRRPGPCTTAANFLALGVGLILVVTLLPIGVAGIAPRDGSYATVGPESTQLVSAAVSLRIGAGPAGGTPEVCSSTSTTSETCSAPSASPNVFPTTATWANVTTKVIPAPSARQTVMVWDAADGYALLFGGLLKVPGEQSYFGVSDTWTYLNGVWSNITNSLIGGSPPDAVNPTMAYDPFEQEVVLFGGASNIQADDQAQTWTYHAGEWTNITNTAGTPPYSRLAAVFTADLFDQQMILFGGLSQNASRTRIYAQTDTWLFKNNVWSNISGQVSGSPPALIYAVGTYDPSESGIIVLGTNYPGPPFYSETYLYSAGKWTNLTAALPTPGPTQVVGLFVWDPSLNAAILSSSIEISAASFNYSISPITWAFYEGNWINITTTAGAPPSGTLAGAALMPDGSIFAFGGTPDAANNTAYSYVFSLPPTITDFVVTPATAVVGAPVSALATFTNGVGPFFQNISWGDGTYIHGNSSASHAYSTTGNFTVTYSLNDFEGRSGSRTVNITISAPPTSSPGGGFSWTSGTGLYILLALIAIVIAVAAVLLVMRSRRKGTATPPPDAAPPSGPPPGSLGSPPAPPPP